MESLNKIATPSQGGKQACGNALQREMTITAAQIRFEYSSFLGYSPLLLYYYEEETNPSTTPVDSFSLD